MIKRISSLLVFTLLLSACSHRYYLPNVHTVPLFKEKNECQLLVATGGGNEISATEVQAAYAVTNHIAAMSSVMFAKGGDVSKNNWGKGYYVEGGMGYYKPLENYAVIEIFGGFGASEQHHQYEYTSVSFWGGGSTKYTGTADLSFTKVFLQPSFGLTFKNFEFALSTRLSYLSFYNINNQIDKRSIEFNYLDTISQNRNSLLLETALTIRGGWKYVKLQLQIGGLNNFTKPGLRFSTSYSSLGLYLSIAKRYRKKREEVPVIKNAYTNY